MSKAHDVHGAILAGGRGTRFWPKSRTDVPKQLLPIIGDKALIRQTFERVCDNVPPDNVWILTSRGLRRKMMVALPEIAADQVIAEPYSRNTAPALGLAALFIKKKAGPSAVMASFHADHVIGDRKGFRRTVAAAIEAARQPNALVTIGIKPSSPHTGYGYIEVEGALDPARSDELPVLKVERFVEKPDLERAKQFLKEGNYLWNSGIFFWRIDSLLQAIDRYMPLLYRDLEIIEREIGTPRESETIKAIFNELEPVAVDTGVMERSDTVLTVPGDFEWNDVGSFATLYDYWEPDENGNRIRGKAITLKSTGLLVDSPNKLVAAVGVDDLIVVDTDSALLICSKRAAQDVGKIVDMLEERGEIEHL